MGVEYGEGVRRSDLFVSFFLLFFPFFLSLFLFFCLSFIFFLSSCSSSCHLTFFLCQRDIAPAVTLSTVFSLSGSNSEGTPVV